MSSVPFYEVVEGLMKTSPLEIVHQVLDDLRVYDILRLISYNKQQINHAIMTHRICAKIFNNSFDTLHSLRETFHFYREVCRSMRQNLAPTDSVLALSIRCPGGKQTVVQEYRIHLWRYQPRKVVQLDFADYESVTQYFASRLTRILDLTERQHEIIVKYARNPQNLSLVWDNSSFSNMKVRWEELLDAQTRMNALKIQQLKRAASLLETNWDILKRNSDPGEKPRPNLQHQLNGMNVAQRRMPGRLLIRDRRIGSCYFHYMQFPVVPFDSALNFVAQEIEKRGLSALRNQPDSVDGEHSADRKSEFEQLSPILPEVAILINGTPLHQGNPEAKVPAWTFHSPSTSETTGEGIVISEESKPEKPCFAHKQGLREPGRLRCNQQKAWEPHDEREVEWLESFVKVYRYLTR